MLANQPVADKEQTEAVGIDIAVVSSRNMKEENHMVPVVELELHKTDYADLYLNSIRQCPMLRYQNSDIVALKCGIM